MYICRECENEVNQGTEICPHCGTDLTAPIPGADPSAAKPGLRKILIRWGVLLGVLLGAIWSFLWFVVPERQGNPTAQAEARAVPSLQGEKAVLQEYAAGEKRLSPAIRGSGRTRAHSGSTRAERQLPDSVHTGPVLGRWQDSCVCASGAI